MERCPIEPAKALAHTPGRWIYDPNNSDIRSNVGGGPMVAEVWSSATIRPAEMDANGRLISAAPDLLAACMAALEEDCGLTCATALREAIEKATGMP